MSSSLLPPDSLKGQRFGLSVSESADLLRLGLSEMHFQLALGEIARCVLVAGGNLAYGGHLNSTGYTMFLKDELQKYGRRDRPLLVCLAWGEHRSISLAELERNQNDLGLHGKIVCLDIDGNEIDPFSGRGEQAIVEKDGSDVRMRSLTNLRRYMCANTQGRIILGGRRHGYSGELPGVVEEALMSLEVGQPIYVAGGFGGVSSDIATTLGLDDGMWLPRHENAPPDDSRLLKGLSLLKAIARDPAWRGANNGLSPEENRRLAATHRPGEIAALVSLGLGRLRIGRVVR